jgi:hypothetical protein
VSIPGTDPSTAFYNINAFSNTPVYTCQGWAIYPAGFYNDTSPNYTLYGNLPPDNYQLYANASFDIGDYNFPTVNLTIGPNASITQDFAIASPAFYSYQVGDITASLDLDLDSGTFPDIVSINAYAYSGGDNPASSAARGISNFSTEVKPLVLIVDPDLAGWNFLLDSSISRYVNTSNSSTTFTEENLFFHLPFGTITSGNHDLPAAAAYSKILPGVGVGHWKVRPPLPPDTTYWNYYWYQNKFADSASAGFGNPDGCGAGSGSGSGSGDDQPEQSGFGAGSAAGTDANGYAEMRMQPGFYCNVYSGTLCLSSPSTEECIDTVPASVELAPHDEVVQDLGAPLVFDRTPQPGSSCSSSIHVQATVQPGQNGTLGQVQVTNGPLTLASGANVDVNVPAKVGLNAVSINASGTDSNGAPVNISHTRMHTVPMQPVGMLPPMGAMVPAGSTPPLPKNAVKSGGQIVFKMQINSCGALVTDPSRVAAPPRYVDLQRNGADVPLSSIEMVDVADHEDGPDFHMDGTSGQWMNHASTKGLQVGTYTLTIQMPDQSKWLTSFVVGK